jgi:hypothetical protein
VSKFFNSNDKCIIWPLIHTQTLFVYLLGLGLLCELFNVHLGFQATIGSNGLIGAGQLLKSLQVLVGKSVGAYWSEGSRRAGARSEELAELENNTNPEK